MLDGDNQVGRTDIAKDVLWAAELDLAGTERVTGDKAQMTYRFETVEVLALANMAGHSAGE